MLRTLPLLLALAAALTACGSSPADAEPFEGREDGVETGVGSVVLYSLRNNAPDSAGVAAVIPPADSATTRWDLGFRGTEVLVNGGSSGLGAGIGVVVDVPFDEIDDALLDDATYRRDGESPCPSGPPRAVCTGPGDGWFETQTLADGREVVVPIPGRTLLLRLGDGQGYAKVEFESYYRGAPDPVEADAQAGVYAFRYAVSPDGTSFLPDE